LDITTAARPFDRRSARRLLAAALLALLACVPSIARVHDRICADRTPAHEHSRFRWTNSCESVPKKVSAAAPVAPADAPAQAEVEPPARTRPDAPATDPLPARSPDRSPHGLRAPPAAA
jgi:hypothetical protein